MENKTNIQLPDNFSVAAVPEKPKRGKVTKVILEERARLPRTNRTIPCAYCSIEKILNPDQYQGYFDYLGSEDKISREFMCKECEMDSKRNPIKFWYKHGELLGELSKHIRIAFDMFNRSSKGNQEFNAMRGMVLYHTKDALIDDANVEFVARQLANNMPEFHTLKLHKIPHVGTIIIKPYENTKDRIDIA